MRNIVNHTKLTLVKMLLTHFLNEMIKEREYCSIILKECNKPMVLTKKYHECFENLIKYSIYRKDMKRVEWQ